MLGVDPGISITGFAILKKDSDKVLLVKCGVIKTSKSASVSQRLRELYLNLSLLFDREKIDHVAVEKIFFNTNLKTVVSVSEARGVILLAASSFEKPIYEYTPLEAKKAVLGDGRASKKEIQQSVKMLLGLEDEPKPDDAADAVAVALCHIYALPYLEIVDDRDC